MRGGAQRRALKRNSEIALERQPRNYVKPSMPQSLAHDPLWREEEKQRPQVARQTSKQAF